MCLIIAVCAAFTTRGRKNKVSNPISHYFFGWPRCRYWITMGLALLSFSFQTFDDIFRIVNSYAEQRLFLTQFVFDCFWDFTRIFLLWNTYDLLFHLMRYAPLGQHTICRLHFWRYEIVRKVICGLLFLIAFVMMCLRISYLSDQVFHPPMSQDKTYLNSYKTLGAAVGLCFLHDILYFLAGLEVLIVSGVLLERKNSKDGAGSKAVGHNFQSTFLSDLLIDSMSHRPTSSPSFGSQPPFSSPACSLSSTPAFVRRHWQTLRVQLLQMATTLT